ncbi:MAG: hypothetical protein IJH75_00955 [Mogibacterium sp.]|nr:hypothetical protein [Mogibacterium sp.]
MEIISFTGKSGTGKSYNAIRVCRENNIDAIIDDGLLIYKGSIVAGSSAKKCALKAAAMRTALFNYEEQRREVREKIEELQPEKLMIIGTSDRMVDWITNALELPAASRRIYIEDVTSVEDREKAAESRFGAGEHVIPAPMVQLKRDFAGYFMNPIRFLRGAAMEDRQQEAERTVVRPAYSYFGRFEINEQVLEDIIDIAAEKYTSCLHVMGFYHNGNTSNLNVVIELRIKKIPGVVHRLIRYQMEVHSVIEKMTAFSVGNINIRIRDVVLPDEVLERRNLWHPFGRKNMKKSSHEKS